MSQSLRCPAWEGQLVAQEVRLGLGGTIRGDKSLDNSITTIMTNDFAKFEKCNVKFDDYGTIFCDSLAGLSSDCEEKAQRLCKTDCLKLQDIYKKVSASSCDASSDAGERVTQLDSYCNDLVDSNCITLEQNRKGNCGYVTIDDICRKCSSADKVLCANAGYDNIFQTQNQTQKTLAILGIVLGGIVCLIVLACPIYLRIKRKTYARDSKFIDGSYLDSTTDQTEDFKRGNEDFGNHRLSSIFMNQRSNLWDQNYRQ